MSKKTRKYTRPPHSKTQGTTIPVMRLDAADAMGGGRRRRMLNAARYAVPVLFVGLVLALTQVKLGGGGSKPKQQVVRGWKSGEALIEAGHLAKGIAVLEAAVGRLPAGAGRVDAHVRLAEVYGELGQHKLHYLNSAIRHYRIAIESGGSTAPLDELLYKTASCFVRLGSYEGALEYLEPLDTEFPNSPYRPQASYSLGECRQGMGQYAQARREFADVADAYRKSPLGEKAFFRFAESFDLQSQSLRRQ